jgi:exopolysaccharide production protein ExoQ
MTVQSHDHRLAGPSPYPPARDRSRARMGPAVRATSWADVAAYVASLAIILIYSQSWAAPMTGYGLRDADFLRNFYYPAYGLAVLIILTRPGHAFRALVSTPWLLLLLGMVALSSLWSLDPSVTQRRLIALSFTTLGGVALAIRWQWRTLIELFAIAFGIMALASLFLGAVLPDMGRMQEIFPGAWRGLWLEKNALGENMGLATLFCLVAGILIPRRRLIWFAVACIAAGLVFLSTSKTSLLVLVISLCSLIFVALVKRGPVMAVLATWLSLFVVASAAIFITVFTDTFLDFLGKDATLTGRTEIWGGILRQMQDHVWTGVGYGVAWDDESLYGAKAWIAHEAKFTAAHAHNGWLELYLGLGLPGVILFGLWFVEMWGRALWSAYARIAGWILVPMMTAYTLTMMSESITMVWHNLRWVLFVALALKAALGLAEAVPPVVKPPARRRRAF